MNPLQQTSSPAVTMIIHQTSSFHPTLSRNETNGIKCQKKLEATMTFITRLISLSLIVSVTTAFPPIALSRKTRSSLQGVLNDSTERRSFVSAAIVITGTTFLPFLSEAIVEGYAPPKKQLSEEYRQGTSALAGMDSDGPVPREAYKTLASGVIYADLRPGTGETVGPGSRVNLQWVLRKSNGYFVDSSEVNDSIPFIFTVGDGNAISGLDEGVQGMRVGGVRRLLIPPSLAYVKGLEDGLPGPVPTGFGPRQQMRRVQTIRKDVPGEYIFLEVQLKRVQKQ